MQNTNKKPFGLIVSIKVALQAIKEGTIPTSTVLSNLFFLQKEKTFPETLTVNDFRKPTNLNELDKKQVRFILEEFKKPGINHSDLLEEILTKDWQYKKVIRTTPVATKPFVKKAKVHVNKPTQNVIITKKQSILKSNP